MTVTSRMFERATVERNSETLKDSYGHPLPPSYEFHMTIPCRVYSSKANQIVDGFKQATIDTLRIAYALDTDIVDADRITKITDRNKQTWYEGNYELKQITRKRTHFEADLKLVE